MNPREMKGILKSLILTEAKGFKEPKQKQNKTTVKSSSDRKIRKKE